MTAAEILPATFDYADLDAETRIVVQQRTSEIKTLARRAASDVVEIGQKLADVKERLGHGQFGQWLSVEFDWSQDTAGRFLAVAAKFGQIPQIAEFAPSALYLLAASSVPDEARADAVARANVGQPITVATAKVIIAEHQPERPADQFATLEQIEAAVRTWLPTYSRERTGQLYALGQIKARTPAGNGPLAKLMDSAAMPRPFRVGDLINACAHVLDELTAPVPQPGRAVSFAPSPGQPAAPGGSQGSNGRAKCKICGRPLSDPASVARGAGDVCSGQHAANAGGNGHAAGGALYASGRSTPEPDDDPEPQPEPETVDLPGTVLAWLDERVENLEMAGDTEARVLCLEQVIKARNGFTQPSGEAAWKSLRAARSWPAWADNDAKIEAVRQAIARLNGEEESETEVQEDETEPVERQRLHSWDGVKPVSGGNGTARKPAIGSDRYNTLLDRKTEHVERGLKAAQALRAWVLKHPDALEDDAELAAAYALIEDFRIQALCLD